MLIILDIIILIKYNEIMIDAQNRKSGEWIMDIDFQIISLCDIKQCRFRFHGKLVEERNYLQAYMEKEIIMARLKGNFIWKRISTGDYKCDR